MTSGDDVAGNLRAAGAHIDAAVEAGAELVVLHENFAFLGRTNEARLEVAERLGAGPMQAFLSSRAREHRIWLVGGTLPIAGDKGKAHAACLIFDPQGARAGRYDKVHLFDVAIPGAVSERYVESAATLPGETPLHLATPGGRLGVAVCYDLRFPALFHRLGQSGVDILVVPAAFTVPTGRAHWEVLLRARAIESMAYVVAAAQCGEHPGGRRTYGRSMVVDPWGDVLAVLDDGPGFVCAELDMMRLARLRETFPVLAHRREL
jgi:nitrilase